MSLLFLIFKLYEIIIVNVFYVLTEIWREIQADTTSTVEDPFDHQNDIDGQAEGCREEGFVVELVDK